MQPYTDEMLVAYTDGELPPVEARAIAVAAETDPALARRIRAFVESRRLLQQAFAARLDEPVPQRLLDALREPSASESRVVPLAPRAAAAATSRPWRRFVPTALAAGIALAVGLSVGGWRGLAPTPVVNADSDAAPLLAGLPPDAALIGAALESRASGVPLAGEQAGLRYEILPTATLRTAGGTLCREFESSVTSPAGTQTAQGLACRGADGRWTPQALVAAVVPAPGAAGGYVPAAGGPAPLAARLGPSERLSPAEEDALIAQGWR